MDGPRPSAGGRPFPTFARPDLHRLELKVFDFNRPAIRVYEKAGFVFEGTARESVPMEDGFWNTITMSILRPEWERAGAVP
jgi:RimJ/RimL family protein N-acetyltransferase